MNVEQERKEDHRSRAQAGSTWLKVGLNEVRCVVNVLATMTTKNKLSFNLADRVLDLKVSQKEFL